MTITQIKEKLVEQISLTIGEEPSNIKSDMLLHELGVDSLGLVELLIFIEKEFGIALMDSGISQDSMMKIDSLAQSIQTAVKEK
jgi:acyl carrier protein